MENFQILPFLIFLIALPVGPFGLFELRRSLKAKRWPVTTGTVLTSKVVPRMRNPKTGRRYKTTLYVPVVVYSYEVDGEELKNDIVHFGAFNTNIPSVAESTASRYLEGDEVKVFYNPKNPKDSLLDPAKITITTKIFSVLGIYAITCLIGFAALVTIVTATGGDWTLYLK